VVAADASTGAEVVLRSGPLARAVRASMGIPGVFQPVAWDGRWLVDGGIVTPLPTRVLHDAGAGVVIASNAAGQDTEGREDGSAAPRLVEVLARMVSTMERQVLTAQVALADVHIRPVVHAANSLDFRQVDRYVEEGARAAEAALPAIDAVLRRHR
jgi:NTE family protein